MAITAEDYRNLSVEERLELIGDIWDSIDDDAPLELTEEDKAEFDRRVAAYDADPTTGKSWEQVRREIFHSSP